MEKNSVNCLIDCVMCIVLSPFELYRGVAELCVKVCNTPTVAKQDRPRLVALRTAAWRRKHRNQVRTSRTEMFLMR